jgi:hypothetical protein
MAWARYGMGATWHGRDMAWAQHGMGATWHGRSMACVNQTRLHCVNQMRETQSKPLAARHGRGTAWERHGMCELAFNGNRKSLDSRSLLRSFKFLREVSGYDVNIHTYLNITKVSQ